jgi:transcriptional regulator with XRE-family HTH domain
LKRVDFEALLRKAEDAADLAAVDAHRAYEDRVGWETARRNYLVADEARRLLDGENPVRLWREKRGLKQRTLAEAAEMAVSYLAEIEGGKKPGSSSALRRIANVLDVPLENLAAIPIDNIRLRPLSRADTAADRLIRLASSGAGRNRLANEAREIVSEWLTFAVQGRDRKQIGAAVEALTFRVRNTSADWRRQSIELDRNGDAKAAFGMRDGLDALESVIDVLREEYRKR